jgi:hypothetical protein
MFFPCNIQWRFPEVQVMDILFTTMWVGFNFSLFFLFLIKTIFVIKKGLPYFNLTKAFRSVSLANLVKLEIIFFYLFFAFTLNFFQAWSIIFFSLFFFVDFKVLSMNFSFFLNNNSKIDPP